MKPGFKTTEFVISIVALVLVNLPQAFSEAEWAKVAGAVGAALIAAGYALSRGIAKASNS